MLVSLSSVLLFKTFLCILHIAQFLYAAVLSGTLGRGFFEANNLEIFQMPSGK